MKTSCNLKFKDLSHIDTDFTLRFINVVYAMRIEQKEYFKSRSRTALENAKELEKELDGMLEAFEQPKLFDL